MRINSNPTLCQRGDSSIIKESGSGECGADTAFGSLMGKIQTLSLSQERAAVTAHAGTSPAGEARADEKSLSSSNAASGKEGADYSRCAPDTAGGKQDSQRFEMAPIQGAEGETPHPAADGAEATVDLLALYSVFSSLTRSAYGTALLARDATGESDLSPVRGNSGKTTVSAGFRIGMIDLGKDGEDSNQLAQIQDPSNSGAVLPSDLLSLFVPAQPESLFVPSMNSGESGGRPFWGNEGDSMSAQAGTVIMDGIPDGESMSLVTGKSEAPNRLPAQTQLFSSLVFDTRKEFSLPGNISSLPSIPNTQLASPGSPSNDLLIAPDANGGLNSPAQFQANPVPQFQTNPVPQFQANSVPQFQANPIPQFQTNPIPQFQTNPIPQFQANPIPQFQTNLVPKPFDSHTSFLMPGGNIADMTILGGLIESPQGLGFFVGPGGDTEKQNLPASSRTATDTTAATQLSDGKSTVAGDLAWPAEILVGQPEPSVIKGVLSPRVRDSGGNINLPNAPIAPPSMFFSGAVEITEPPAAAVTPQAGTMPSCSGISIPLASNHSSTAQLPAAWVDIVDVLVQQATSESTSPVAVVGLDESAGSLLELLEGNVLNALASVALPTQADPSIMEESATLPGTVGARLESRPENLSVIIGAAPDSPVSSTPIDSSLSPEVPLSPATENESPLCATGSDPNRPPVLSQSTLDSGNTQDAGLSRKSQESQKPPAIIPEGSRFQSATDRIPALPEQEITKQDSRRPNMQRIEDSPADRAISPQGARALASNPASSANEAEMVEPQPMESARSAQEPQLGNANVGRPHKSSTEGPAITTSPSLLNAGGSTDVKISGLARAASPGTSDPQHEFLLQLTERMQAQLQDGTNAIRIRLRPENLGHLEIKAETAINGVIARIVTESSTVRQYLEGHIHILQQSLQDQGLKVEKIEVVLQEGFDGREGSQNQTAGQSGHNHESDGRTAFRSQVTDSRHNFSKDEAVLDASALRILGPNNTFHTIA